MILSFINTTKDYFSGPVLVGFNQFLSLLSGLERIKEEDAEKAVAGVIAALFKTLQQKENTIRPLSTTAIERREEILATNYPKINDAIEVLKSNFIDNQGDFAELLVEEDNDGVMADLI